MAAIHALAAADSQQIVTGQFIGVDEESRPLVTYENHLEPVIAKAIVSVNDDPKLLSGAQVLLFLGAGTPIIMGFVSESLNNEAINNSGLLGDTLTSSLHVDGKKINLQAQNEVVLKCGKSSISLARNGKITIKGKDVISRSSGANKIKGANVRIN